MAVYYGLAPFRPSISWKADYRSYHLTRRMLIEVAYAISRTRADSKLKRFYFRIKSRHGAKVAIVALARKIICILHHLIIGRKVIMDEATSKPKRNKPSDS